MNNKKQLKFVFWLTIAQLGNMIRGSTALAQITPDTTLPNNTAVTRNGQIITIDQGTMRGNNLFHSFTEFHVGTGETAFFNNGLSIDNILTRVTGGQLSSIDGLIQANGTANLFLLNPNGIQFGPNARLDIGGSFLVSTAESLIFEDGSIYSATNPTEPPLLTVNVPIGLQFGSNPGTIVVQGQGHELAIPDPIFTPIDRGSQTRGLRVNSGQTLSLIGGDVFLEGGLLRTEGGNLQLGSVQEETVNLNLLNRGWTLDYDSVTNFGDIKLSQLSLVDASGSPGGSIQVQARNLVLQDASSFLIQNRGSQTAGDIQVQATESLTLQGNDVTGILFSNMFNQALEEGNGGNITVTTPRLTLLNGARIMAQVFGTGNGGNLTFDVAESINVTGFLPGNPARTSVIGAYVVGEGTGGDIDVSTKKISIIDGGTLATVTFDAGDAGDIVINASDSIEFRGVEPEVLTPSIGGSLGLGVTGDAGDVWVNTSRLIIRDGGSLESSARGTGNAGSLTIKATDFVEVSGTVPGTTQPSLINSAVILDSPEFRAEFGIPDVLFGDSGNLSIETGFLRVSDGGVIAVRNDGFGLGGSVTIRANSLELNNQGVITAATQSGEGGNIEIQVQELLLLNNNSQITTEAGGSGNGGDINIQTTFVVAANNSDIIANAFEGNGGNIQIDASSIFGTQFRDSLTPESDITASSEFGLAGTVIINNPDVNPTSGLVELPAQVTDPSDQVVAGCAATSGNSFTITGRGGLPEDPTATIRGQTILSDLRDFTASDSNQDLPLVKKQSRQELPKSIVQVKGWIVNQDGEVELVATLPQEKSFGQYSNCQDLERENILE